MPLIDPVTMSSQLKTTSSKTKVATVARIPLLDNALSKAVAIGRPGLLLSLLAYQFKELVADPVNALLVSLPVVAAIQIAYAALALPIAGSQGSRTGKKSRPGEKKRTDAAGPNPVSSAIIALVLTAISTPFVHVLFVLFGAPFLDHVPHTFLCATHFSVLALFPTFYSKGIEHEAFLAVAGVSAPFDETFGALFGAVIGAWLGAIPIPLDWDRPWQNWPITIVVGMYMGSCLGSRLGGTVFYNRSFRDH